MPTSAADADQDAVLPLGRAGPTCDGLERRIFEQPSITVPTIVLDGEPDTVPPARVREEQEPHFSPLLDGRLVDAGHNLPQEALEECARAVIDVHDWPRRGSALRMRAVNC